MTHDVTAIQARAYAAATLPALVCGAFELGEAVDVSDKYMTAEGSTFDVAFTAYGAPHVFTVWRLGNGQLYGEW